MFLLIYTYRTTSKLVAGLAEFHAFLTGYRQTPRSRIFKKNLPNSSDGLMEPIMEADSFLEHSVVSSQLVGGSKLGSKLQSMVKSRMSIKSTRFVFDEFGENHGEIEVDENDNDVGVKEPPRLGSHVEVEYFHGSVDSFKR